MRTYLNSKNVQYLNVQRESLHHINNASTPKRIPDNAPFSQQNLYFVLFMEIYQYSTGNLPLTYLYPEKLKINNPPYPKKDFE